MLDKRKRGWRTLQLPTAQRYSVTRQCLSSERAGHVVRSIKMATVLALIVHHTLLATWTEAGRRNRPDLCVDPAGVIRDDIHKQTVDLAAAFFQANLK